MKASPRPRYNPARVAQVVLLVVALSMLVIIGAFGWPEGEGVVRFLLFIFIAGGGYGGIYILDKVRIRAEFPLNAEGASLFAGWQALMRQDWSSALRAYQGTLAKFPKSTEALLHAAALEIQFDNLDAAEAHLKEILALCPDDPEVHFTHAILLHNRGRFLDAAAEYVFHAEPHDYRARVGRAVALYQAKQRDAAWEEVRKAAAEYTQTRFQRSVDVEMPAWALAQGLVFLAPSAEVGDKELLRVFQWTESFWHGWKWSAEFDELDRARAHRERHLLQFRVLLDKAEEHELTDLFGSREIEDEYVLAGWFTVAVKHSRGANQVKARTAWLRFLEEAQRLTAPVLIPSFRSFEGCLARHEAERLK